MRGNLTKYKRQFHCYIIGIYISLLYFLSSYLCSYFCLFFSSIALEMISIIKIPEAIIVVQTGILKYFVSSVILSESPNLIVQIVINSNEMIQKYKISYRQYYFFQIVSAEAARLKIKKCRKSLMITTAITAGPKRTTFLLQNDKITY